MRALSILDIPYRVKASTCRDRLKSQQPKGTASLAPLPGALDWGPASACASASCGAGKCGVSLVHDPGGRGC